MTAPINPQPPSKLTGTCVNPACGHRLRSRGYVTDETRGARRHNKDSVCSACSRSGYLVDPDKMSDTQLFHGFEWTPALLNDAVEHAMRGLDDAA